MTYTINAIIVLGDVSMSIMLKELLSAPNALKTIINTNKQTIDSLTNELSKRKLSFITTIARGTSNNAASFFKYLCEQQTGIMVTRFNHSITTISKKTTKLKDSLCICISQSGTGADTISVAEMAKAQGALTLAVTNNPDSPLAKLCHYHLYLNCGEEKSVAATKTYTVQIACMVLLVGILSNKHSIDFNSDIVIELNNYIKDTQPIQKLAHNLKDINNLIIMSRGETLPIAEELSLKLLETCYKLSRCYSVAEFAHGPYALIEKGRTVIILAPDGIYRNDFINIIKKIKRDGASIVAITDIAEIIKLADYSLCVPYKPSNPYHYILTIQIFAAYMAEALGLNPDKPRGLKKVTQTF